MEKYVYSFNEGNKDQRNLLGGKGANLSEMINLGLPVPSGFIVATTACTNYYDNNKVLNDEIIKQIFIKLNELEEKTGKTFGDKINPLLVSIRSGARISMPGMMDTILNLGLNDIVAENFAKETNNPRFVYDSYRRLIQMYADVVKGYPKKSFEEILTNIKVEKQIENDFDLTTEDIKQIIIKYKNLYKELADEEFPQDPKIQLLEAITAVFRSWNTSRAIYYRKINNIPESWGTAVNVQEMVYGNKGNDSGTGVAFTRNPSTGEKKLYGEFLINAQGEDVVAGIRTPEEIDSLKTLMPEVYDEFIKTAEILENHYKDMQDMEFTIEDNKLYMLQTRNGKRTAQATLKIAVDLVNENLITKEEAILKIEPTQLENLLHPVFDLNELKDSKIIATGLAASPGAASGKLCFTAEDAVKLYNDGEKNLILVRLDTSPEDIEGMHIVNGILTIRGGTTSHAAVVARGMGKCCISGCSEFTIDTVNKTLIKDNIVFNELDYISLDGTTGNVYEGEIKTVETEMSQDFTTFMNWVDEIKTMKIRANADTKIDAEMAIKYGAEGIGLCRTEHMFFKEDRIFEMRKMIIAETKEQREEALENILPMQKEDFEQIYEVMNGFPVTIRYLDPPLHEFLPKTDEEINELATELKIDFKDIKEHINSLHEFNPMMGHRGCRLSITYPEIAIMQTKAVIEAAINVKNKGINVIPEIMIPLIGDINELRYIKEVVERTANEVIKNNNATLEYTIGTMIEIPRAALTADEIATEAKFFSFGTNDLTQMTYGFSRDDSTKFLNEYYEKGIFKIDPFKTLDTIGVGKLIQTAIVLARSTNKDIKLGLCGEHGGDPLSIEFCHNIGLNYVSCSPYRIPIARLAAAQAKIRTNM